MTEAFFECFFVEHFEFTQSQERYRATSRIGVIRGQEDIEFLADTVRLPQDDPGGESTESQFEGVAIARVLRGLKRFQNVRPASVAGGQVAFAESPHLQCCAPFRVDADGDRGDQPQQGEDYGAGGDGDAVAANPFLNDSDHSRRSGLHGADFEEGPEVGDQGGDVGVTFRRVGRHRFRTDRGQIAGHDRVEVSDRRRWSGQDAGSEFGRRR